MTSIEWLIEMVSKMGYVSADIVEQAKEMHKKEIIDAYHTNPQEAKWKNIGINYYNETFGSRGSAKDC